MPEPGGFALIPSQQQIHVLEQKLTAIFERDLSRRAAGRQVGGLRKNPRIAKDAPPDQHAADAGRHPREDILGLDAVPEPRTGMLTDSATRSIRLQSECPE